MKSVLFFLAALASVALANTAPTVVIQSATMRPGTTLMDVVYRVNDPDDATVKTRALAFVDGVRSFANVIKPVSFVEGTAAKLGDAIPANVDHTLTWDVAADWNIDLGQVKFEVLAMDGRGLLPIDWITIPAAGGKPEITISGNNNTDSQVLDGLFWQFGSGDENLSLQNGILTGSASSGEFTGADLAKNNNPRILGHAFLMKCMNLDPASLEEEQLAQKDARFGAAQTRFWRAIKRPYQGIYLPIINSIDADSRKIVQIQGDSNAGFAIFESGMVQRWGEVQIQRFSPTWPYFQEWEGIVPPSIPERFENVSRIYFAGTFGVAIMKDGSSDSWGFSYNAAWSGGGRLVATNIKDFVIGGRSWFSYDTDPLVAYLTKDGSLHLLSQELSFGGFPYAPNAIKLVGFDQHFATLSSNGDVYVGGYQAGYLSQNLDSGPVLDSGPILAFSEAVDIAAGPACVLAVKADGTVAGFGPFHHEDILPQISGAKAIFGASGGGFYILKGDNSVIGLGAYVPPILKEVRFIQNVEGRYDIAGKALDP